MTETSPPTVSIPVVLVPTSPFTVIALDENDKLDCTLAQINSHTYDYLKLCRSTMSVDGELPAMRDIGAGVIVTYTGSFMFPRMKGIDKSTAIDTSNLLLLRLLFSGLRFDAVSPEDVGFGFVYGTGYYRMIGGSSGANYGLINALQQRGAGSFDTIRLIEPRTFTKAQITDALASGKPITDKLPEINPSIILDGITYYTQYRLASALVFLWSTAETLLNRMWIDKVVPRGVGIVGRKSFVEGNSWQAASKAEVLYQVGVISDDLYSRANQARQARNALAHKGAAPSLEVCDAALEAVFALMSTVVTDYSDSHKFDGLVANLKRSHEPPSSKVEPKFWREILPVPGDEKWGAKPYPKYPEIELVSLKANSE